MATTGKLIVVATPIGNLGDISERAREALATADGWLVEDTRISGKLQVVLDLRKPMRVVNDHTSESKIHHYLADLKSGKTLALLSDGGTPVISDPGTEIVDCCYSEGISVESIPGPSAVTVALSLSGFYAQRYAFLGFLGKKTGAITKELEPFVESPYTLVLFESQHRIRQTLEVALNVLGDRRVAVCRELTKLHEEVHRFRLGSMEAESFDRFRGEITVVLEGKRRNSQSET